MDKKKRSFTILKIRIKDYKRFVLFVLIVLLICTLLVGYFYFKQSSLQKKRDKGMENFSRGNFEEAIENFNQIESKDKNVLFNLAVSYYNKKDYEKAEYFYKEILKLDPSSALAYNGIGNMYRDKKNYEKARENYEKAMSAQPEFVLSYSNLVMMLLNEGNRKEASQVLKQGIENNPESPEWEKIEKIINFDKN